MSERFPFGATVRERVSGFEGVVVGEAVYLNGCVHYVVKPRSLDSNGIPVESQTIEAGMLLPKPDIELVPFDEPCESFPLGIKVKDRYSEFSGISYGHMRWAHGASRVLVNPGKLHDRKPVEACWFDQEDLVHTEDSMIQSGDSPSTLGGPRDFRNP